MIFCNLLSNCVVFLIVLGFCGVGQEDFPHNAHHREIAISISNYTLRHGDSGLIIVGGRMEMQPHVYLLSSFLIVAFILSLVVLFKSSCNFLFIKYGF